MFCFGTSLCAFLLYANAALIRVRATIMSENSSPPQFIHLQSCIEGASPVFIYAHSL